MEIKFEPVIDESYAELAVGLINTAAESAMTDEKREQFLRIARKHIHDQLQSLALRAFRRGMEFERIRYTMEKVKE